MKALIIYDSFFSNTEKIARAIGKGLGTAKEVSIVKAGEAKLDQLQGMDLLVVGSPTRAFSQSPDMKTFLRSIPAGSLKGIKAAAFDTRMDMTKVTSGFLKFMVKLFGFADKNLEAGLKRAGCAVLIPAEGFVVKDTEGPLDEGELERAKAWGKYILTIL